MGEGAKRVTTGASDIGGGLVETGGSSAGAPLSTRLPRLPSLGAALRLARAEAAAQADRWFLWSPAAFGLGCAGYLALRSEPPLWLAVAGAVLACGVAAAVRRRVPSRALGMAATLAAFLACGVLAAKLRTLWAAAPAIAERGARGIDGWVLDVASPGAGGGRLLIAPWRIDGLTPEATPRLLRVTVGPDALAGPGSAVRLRAVLNPSPGPAAPGAYDFARDAYFEGIGGVGFALSDPATTAGPRPPWTLRLAMAVNAARWSLARRIVEDLGRRDGGVAAAMVTGHEAWLDPDDEEAMRRSGLAHILSISGVHMAIVGGFVFLLARTLIAAWPWLALRAPGKKIAAAAALVAIAVYLVTSGAPPPAVRAAVTLSVAFVAVLADRQAISLHSLAVAALIVLAMRPEAVAQPGFQMSFAATAALVALAEAWPRPVREINAPWPIRAVQAAGVWLGASLGASLVAGMATSPFAIQHFNRVALYGLPANLLLAPLSSFLIMPALAAGAVGEALGQGGPPLAVAGWGIAAMLWLAGRVSEWPHAVMVVASAPAAATVTAFLGLLWLCLWKGRLRLLGLPAALAVTLWPRPAPPVAWIAPDGGAAAVVEGRTAVWLRPEAKRFASELWARRRGLAEPDDPDAARDRAYACNRLRCLPTGAARPRLAAWWTRRRPKPADLARLCAGADIVILKAEVDPDSCPAGRVLTAGDFARGGAVEIFRARGGWRYVWGNAARGARPWTQ